MSRTIKAFIAFFSFFLLLIIGEIVGEIHRLPYRIGDALPHLSDLAGTVVAGIVLLWVFEEAVQRHIAPSIRQGLSDFATLVAVNLKTQLEVPPSVVRDFTTAVGELIEQHVKTPEVVEFLEQGKIGEAAERARAEDEEITVFLASTKASDWDKGIALLRKMKDQNPQYYVTFSYLFWDTKNFEKAKEIAEEGLRIAERKDDKINAAKLKNTLSYVYAELGRLEDESKAREYAAEALADEPESPTRLDTMAFVSLMFAKSDTEISEGISLADRARTKGLSFSDYAKNIALACEKLNSLRSHTQQANK